MIAKLLVIISVALHCHAYSIGYPSSPIQAAISSTRTVQLTPVSLPQDPILPQVLEVAALELPIQIIYNSRSSPVLVHQNHVPGAPGQVEKTTSQEEPLVVINEVTRPVIQELREIITPYRRVVQEVAPVVETINTVVAKGQQPVAAVQVAPVAQVAAPQPVAALSAPLVETLSAPLVAPISAPLVATPLKYDTPVASASAPAPVLTVNNVGYTSLMDYISHLRAASAAAAASS